MLGPAQTLQLHCLGKTQPTVDGRIPAPKQPPWMYETLQIMEKTTYQLVLEFFFHQQYI